MTDKNRSLVSQDTNQFLQAVEHHPPARVRSNARLVFAMDATLSRQPSWDRACALQGQMFESTDALGGLAVQLCYYRGLAEFEASQWCTDTNTLLKQMSGVTCRGGYTQIARILKHVLAEKEPVRAVVFVGDALEENPDELCELAGQLGIRNIPLFVFQEGNDRVVAATFRQMATLSGGAWSPFDINSASQLRDLLSAAAVYAAGGQSALLKLTQTGHIKRLTRQVR